MPVSQVENIYELYNQRGVSSFGFFKTGNYSMRLRATPLMQSVAYAAAKKVPNPDETDTKFKTVYDKWMYAFPNADQSRPRYNLKYMRTYIHISSILKKIPLQRYKTNFILTRFLIT